VKHAAIGAILGALLPITTWGETDWVNDQAVQQQLADGQVATQVVFDSGGTGMRIKAAVRVNASPEVIWRVLTDCEHAANLIPGVKRCRRLESAPDGSWDLVEQEAKYSWVMPSVTCIVRATYKRPERIDFKRISGDLKDEEGTWLLAPPEDPGGGGSETPRPTTMAEPARSAAAPTLVEYEIYVDPGFWIPRVLVRHSLRSELPAGLIGLREQAESMAAER
jgi:Polyketide cyclase / dehydrase and lipid transport